MKLEVSDNQDLSLPPIFNPFTVYYYDLEYEYLSECVAGSTNHTSWTLASRVVSSSLPDRNCDPLLRPAEVGIGSTWTTCSVVMA